MSKKIKEKRLRCIAYLSTTGDFENVDRRERNQLKYIQEYARAHNVEIVKIFHRNVLGQRDVNRHLDYMIRLIREKKADGIILANMLAISRDIPDAYYKVGKVKAAGGHIVTVDEGRLSLYIKKGAENETN